MCKRKKITTENYGEWALVTGASSGVGKEIAQELALKGLSIVLVARDEEKLRMIAKEIEEASKVKIKVVAADLSKSVAITKVIQACEGLEVGILANVAGYALDGEFLEHEAEEEYALLSVNVTAPMLLTHHFAKAMKERKKGGVLFVSSIMALGAASGWAHYNATKAHNLLLAEGLGEELKPYGVHVIALTPGSIKSDFQKRSNTKSMLGALKPKRVAKCGLWMLAANRRTHTAGIMNKIIAFATRITPRSINTKIFSAVVKSLKV